MIHLKCPKCAVEMQVLNRYGIDYDFCPICNGIWLDRGELTALFERHVRVIPVLSFSLEDHAEELELISSDGSISLASLLEWLRQQQ